MFRSWGAFAIGLGILTVGLACTSFRAGERWAWWLLGLATLTTLSIFAWVNFILGSDFLIVIMLAALTVLIALWRARKVMYSAN